MQIKTPIVSVEVNYFQGTYCINDVALGADGCPSQTRTHERARFDTLTYFQSFLCTPLTGQATSNRNLQTSSTALIVQIDQGALKTT